MTNQHQLRNVTGIHKPSPVALWNTKVPIIGTLQNHAGSRSLFGYFLPILFYDCEFEYFFVTYCFHLLYSTQVCGFGCSHIYCCCSVLRIEVKGQRIIMPASSLFVCLLDSCAYLNKYRRTNKGTHKQTTHILTNKDDISKQEKVNTHKHTIIEFILYLEG